MRKMTRQQRRKALRDMRKVIASNPEQIAAEAYHHYKNALAKGETDDSLRKRLETESPEFRETIFHAVDELSKHIDFSRRPRR